MPLDLDSPYQISKVVGEFYCVLLPQHFGLPTVRARFQNVYGPGEIARRRRLARHPRDGLAQRRRRRSSTARSRACRCGSTTAARRSRDFIYVDDIVEGLLRCGALGAPGDVYNLAGRRRDDDPRAGGDRSCG